MIPHPTDAARPAAPFSLFVFLRDAPHSSAGCQQKGGGGGVVFYVVVMKTHNKGGGGMEGGGSMAVAQGADSDGGVVAY